ncbi:MAG: thioredoxin family protein [Thermoguttaceae bacterium]
MRIARPFTPAQARSVPACLGILAAVVFATAVLGADDLWQTNFETAKAKAKAEKKLLLVDFTGSDWCGWCIKLKNEVFDKEEFQTQAPKQFVLVEADFPSQKKLPAELKAQNDKLAKKYAIRGFPTILLLDAEGAVVAQTGYRSDGPEKYMQHLADFIKVYDTVCTMRAELDKAQGLDRAKLLDQLIEAYGKLNNEIDQIEGWSKEIVTLDAGNKAGLKIKYQCRLLMAEAAKLMQSGKFDDAQNSLGKLLALPGLSGEQKQDAYFAQGECLFNHRDFPGVVASLKKALEAAPNSPKAAVIRPTIQHFTPIADAQSAVAKIKVDLEKAKGMERATLLDKMIDARGQLLPFIPDRAWPQEMEQLSQEIIQLDPENKAGLKRKYEFRVMLAEAASLFQAQQPEKAQGALDKALLLPGLTGEQTQEAQLAKGAAYFGQKEFQKAVACFKKGIEAAPDGPRAVILKTLTRRAESELEKQKSQPRPAGQKQESKQ